LQESSGVNTDSSEELDIQKGFRTPPKFRTNF